MPSAKERLEQVLREDVPEATERAASALDAACLGLQDRLVLFGAGRFGRMAQRKLKQLGIHPLAFSDNNPALWGTEINGTPVIAPQQAAEEFGQSAAFILCVWNGEAHDRMADRIAQLRALGCQAVTTFGPLFWRYHKVFLPHYSVDLPQKVLSEDSAVRAAMQLWSDEYSREEFVGQLEFRTRFDFGGISRSVPGKHYFPNSMFWLHEEEVFVDCGAFDGDTITDFVEHRGGRFKSVHAYEPDRITFPKLRERLSGLDTSLRERISVHQKAIGSRPGILSFEATGTMLSSLGGGAETVTVATLDSELEGIEPTYIKFDIEGFEPDGLMGAARTLERCRPIMAVSAYHLQNHLWRIPLLLASLVGENYRFYLRPHGAESWDLVCYAIPAERMMK